MKPPFDFGLKFFLRALFPGFILALIAFPAINTFIATCGLKIDDGYLLASTSLFLGWLCSLFDMPIYMLFEARRFWPSKLKTWRISREQRRMIKLRDRAFDPSDQSAAREASTRLRRDFYFDADGTFKVRYPTRLGNLIDAFERYSYRVYGFEITFLWYRIWLRLDKDTRDEVDNTQAVADSSLYVTAALCVGSIISMFYFVIASTRAAFYRPGETSNIYFISSILFAIFAYSLYRTSIFAQDRFGRLLRAVIDNYVADISYPKVDVQIDRILEGKPIDIMQQKKRNEMIVDYMFSSRITSPFDNKRRLWISEWNEYIEQQAQSGTLKEGSSGTVPARATPTPTTSCARSPCRRR